MHTTKKQLNVFGYGLAMLIPLVTLLHIIKHGFLFALLILIGALYIISKLDKLKGIYYIAYFCVMALMITALTGGKAGAISFFLLLLGVIILFISIININILRPVYKFWMSLAHGIGTIFFNTMLTVIFYLIFTPVGIVLRIIKKDLLDERIDVKKGTYWREKEKREFKQEDYTKQF